MKHHHEPDSRTQAVANWRTSDAFTQRERAALAWTELLTRLNGDQNEPVSDEEYAAARQHFGDKDLVDLSLTIAAINAWNRLGVAFRPQWREPRSASAIPANPSAEAR
jgi:alkylhydroperoxidase family enzyme